MAVSGRPPVYRSSPFAVSHSPCAVTICR